MNQLNRRPILTRRQYAGLALSFAFLAIYGSLVPFDFQPVPEGEAQARFRAVLSGPIQVVSRSDWLANILLFIPLGFLLTAALAVDSPWYASLLAAFLVVPACALLSAAIEFVQVYYPSRIPSINDMAAETLGALIGAFLWLAAGSNLTNRLRQVWSGRGGQNSASLLLPVYLLFLLLVQAMPFDLTLSPVEVYRKYKSGRIVLLLWAGEEPAILAALQKDLINLTFFVPIGLLLAGLPAASWQQKRTWFKVALLGTGLALVIEMEQLFVLSRSSKATDVLTGGLGVLAGWLIGLTCCRRSAHSPLAVLGPVPHACLWAGYLALLVFVSWQPCRFDFSPSTAFDRLSQTPRIPFQDYFAGEYLNAFDQIVEKSLLFVPLGMLLATYQRGSASWRTTLFVLLFGGLVALVLECGQLFLPTRYASVTDILMGSLAGCAGWAVTTHVY